MSEKRYTVGELEFKGFTLHSAGDIMFKDIDHKHREIYVFSGKNDKGEMLFRFEKYDPIYSKEVAGLT